MTTVFWTANSAPASPAIAALTTKAIILMRTSDTPAAVAADGLSRTATSARPKRERSEVGHADERQDVERERQPVEVERGERVAQHHRLGNADDAGEARASARAIRQKAAHDLGEAQGDQGEVPGREPEGGSATTAPTAAATTMASSAAGQNDQ